MSELECRFRATLSLLGLRRVLLVLHSDAGVALWREEFEEIGVLRGWREPCSEGGP